MRLYKYKNYIVGIIKNLLNYIAYARIKKFCHIDVSTHTKVNYRGIRFKNKCTLRIGENSIFEGAIFFEKDGACINIGERVFIGSSTLVCAENIEIGDDVLISWGCTIVDHNSHSLSWKLRSGDVLNWFDGKKDWGAVRTGPVKICSRAWLGFNVIVLKGITIGEGAVIGAGSLVSKDVPPYTVVAGNPAKLIREIPIDER